MLKHLSFVAVTTMKWNVRVKVKQIKIKLKFSKEPVQDMRKSSIRFVLMIASVHIVCMIKCYFFFLPENENRERKWKTEFIKLGTKQLVQINQQHKRQNQIPSLGN